MSLPEHQFITLDEVLVIHDRMLSIGGGSGGVRDFGLLHSAIERARVQFGGAYLYETLWLMAAAQLQSLVKNHPFVDGNKRTAFFATIRLIHKNGYSIDAQSDEIVTFMVSVDVEKLSLEDISIWLKNHSKKL